MLRLPAVAGKFYPASPSELSALIKKCSQAVPENPLTPYRACLVPHAGYIYSGHVAGAAFARIAFPKRVIVLGVRHFPGGEDVAIFPPGSWRTPLGDAPIDTGLAADLARSCPLLREDSVAHEKEHSLEVQIPFLQVLHPGFSFVPIALGTLDYDVLVAVGDALSKTLASSQDVFLLTTTDLNHYENDATTRQKDALAIEKILAFDPRGLYDVCRKNKISMCGLGPTVAMLTALRQIGAKDAELVAHATSADVSGDTRSVVGYAGFLFR
jgi:MEMO1 family protein